MNRPMSSERALVESGALQITCDVASGSDAFRSLHGGWRRFFFVRRAGPSHVQACVGPRTLGGQRKIGDRTAHGLRDTEQVRSAKAEPYRNALHRLQPSWRVAPIFLCPPRRAVPRTRVCRPEDGRRKIGDRTRVWPTRTEQVSSAKAEPYSWRSTTPGAAR